MTAAGEQSQPAGSGAPPEDKVQEDKVRINHQLQCIGKYQVLPGMLGDGGYCSVYPCRYPMSTGGEVTVAVKLSTSAVFDYDGDKVLLEMLLQTLHDR